MAWQRIAASLARLADYDFEGLCLEGRARGRGRRRTAGKCKGRRLNPMRDDGKRMTCNTRGSDKHFQSQCSRGGVKRDQSSRSGCYRVR
eukprot:8052909-Pyramimonas_sp.AAC.1